MWIPKSEAEIKRAIENGTTDETAIFEAKVLPRAGKDNDKLAADIAALTLQGGTLLYGLNEDEHGRPTILAPFELNGVPERIMQVIQTLVYETPYVEFRQIDSELEDGKGYLLVIVPRSDRAPHMVYRKNKQNAYYGRTASGKYMLNEWEVAAAYKRRNDVETDATEMLMKAVAYSPEPEADKGAMTLMIRPLLSNKNLTKNGASRAGHAGRLPFLNTILRQSAESAPRVYPNFRHASFDNRGIDRVESIVSVANEHPPHHRITVFNSGEVHIYVGIIARHQEGELSHTLLEKTLAANLIQAFAFATTLYQSADYYGNVDLGIHLTNIDDVKIYREREHYFSQMEATSFDQDSYTEVARVSIGEMKNDPVSVGKRLIGELFNYLIGNRPIDPWNFG